MNLPDKHEPYIDKYFLRAKSILEMEELNPRVVAQVFIRRGDTHVFGIKEAIDIITKYGGPEIQILALEDGDYIIPGEVIMKIIAPIQSIIDLETMYLGVISAETTLRNSNEDIDLKKIEENMGTIVKLAGKRPVSYFGARHWRYDRDAEISKACFNAGASDCSTDIGAKTNNKEGIGTIPHALETVYHYSVEPNRAVVEAMLAFDSFMDPKIPRIALIDYANREISDTLKTAMEMSEVSKSGLYGIRIDTCGENVMESGMFMDEKSFWFGRGVSVSGVHNVRKMLDSNGFKNVKIMLSSGFGNPEKVKAFLDAEKILGMRLFDSLGVGGVFTSRMATMDIMEIQTKQVHKTGRKKKDWSKLKKVV